MFLNWRCESLDKYNKTRPIQLYVAENIVEKNEQRKTKTRESSPKHISTSVEMARLVVLPEGGGALPNDLRLLQPLSSTLWRPYCGSDGTSCPLRQTKYRRRL